MHDSNDEWSVRFIDFDFIKFIAVKTDPQIYGFPSNDKISRENYSK